MSLRWPRKRNCSEAHVKSPQKKRDEKLPPIVLLGSITIQEIGKMCDLKTRKQNKTSRYTFF
jgi:hypothetical protein